MTEIHSIPWKRLSAEVVAIVGSILLAFAIDAWWQDVQDARRQERLVAALLLDFETTKSRLESNIEYADALLDRTNNFFAAIGADEVVTNDSLRFFGAGAFHKIDFEPALSVYEGAVATGEFGRIESPELHRSITDFNRALDSYELHDRITADIHYLGPIWDLRQELGSLSVLFDDPSAYPIPHNLTESEIRQLYSDPLVTGAIEAVATANESIVNNLRSMNEATATILGELEKLQ